MYVLFATVIVAGFLLWNERTAAFRSGCVGNYCFIMSEFGNNETLNQTDAQQWCRNNGSQLVEIVSQDVQDAIETFIRDKSIYRPVNGWYFKTNGIRLSGNWSRLSGREMANITVRQNNGAPYGYLNSSTTSFDIYATTPRGLQEIDRKGYICADNSSCSDGMRMADGQCYRSYSQTTRLSWYDARNQCLNKSGDLASFDYITSNDGFRQLNTSWLNTSVSYWIGIRRESWTWQGSDSDVKYSNWERTEPSSLLDCLCLYQPATDNSSSLQWISCGCGSLNPFLCLSASRFPDNSGPTDSPNRPSESNESSSGLSLEAQVAIGVAVGVGGLVLIVVVVFIIVAIILNRKHHYKRTSKKKPNAQVKQKKQKQTKEPIYMTTIEKGEKGEGVEQEGNVGREDDKKGGEEDEKGEEDVKGGEEDEKGREEGDEEGKEGEKGGEGENVSIEGDKIVGLYGTVPQTEDSTEDLDSTSMSHQQQEQQEEDQPQTLYQTFEIVENSDENPDEDERHSIRSQTE